MKAYLLYKNELGIIKAVKHGWSWPAFFFAPFWALYKQLWKVLVLFLIFIFFNFLGLTVPFIFGIFGNRWCEDRLITHQFKIKNKVLAHNIREAINKHWTLEN